MRNRIPSLCSSFRSRTMRRPFASELINAFQPRRAVRTPVLHFRAGQPQSSLSPEPVVAVYTLL